MYNDTESSPWDNVENESIKLRRFGLDALQPFRKVNKLLNVLTTKCNTPTIAIANIKNNDPKPHASITPISQENIEKHTLCGRRFDVSMLMYAVQSCSCCGRTEPVHLDPEFPNNAPFERKHFIHTYTVRFANEIGSIWFYSTDDRSDYTIRTAVINLVF